MPIRHHLENKASVCTPRTFGDTCLKDYILVSVAERGAKWIGGVGGARPVVSKIWFPPHVKLVSLWVEWATCSEQPVSRWA